MIIPNIAPTRSNLLRLRSSYAVAREGFDILDQKREVLTRTFLSTVTQAEQQQKKVNHLLKEAYEVLLMARLTMGREKVEWAALSVNDITEVSILNVGMMGVPLPKVTMKSEQSALTYSFGDTSSPLDLSQQAFRKVLDEIPELTRLQVSVVRIARELKKTQRRVNALERIFIPNYQDTINFIEDNLEEQDREEVFRLQWLKKKEEAQ